MKKYLLKTLKFTGITLGSIVLFLVLYILLAVGISRISVNDVGVAEAKDVEIYIHTNGVHTDVIVPVRNSQIDWSKEIKFTEIKAQDSTFQYLSFGWGDKGFYLNTPTWADLTFSTAFNACFGLSSSAMHTEFYKRINENENCRKLFISKTEYADLVKYIRESFQTDNNGNLVQIQNAGYNLRDAFYEAKGTYSLFYTCNTWANNALKSGHQKACLWTPFDSGIFYHYAEK
ncbi:MAG: TIGR02117 family protein [Sphingobacteriales bacterium]|nr:MAG: TIGR02117 family protein [Sphingobacteriales bacterium]